MKYENNLFRSVYWILLVGLVATSCKDILEELRPKGEPTESLLPDGFRSQFAQVNNIKLHFVIGGQGDPLVLLHGFPQTWYEWHRIMPALAEHYTVIAPDLRGAGLSDKPEAKDGYSGSLLAEDIYQLVEQLGYDTIRLVGHDIGGLTAYAYASAYPVEKLAMLEAFVPGIEPVYSLVLQSPATWHISFFQEENAAWIVAGDEKLFLNEFFDRFSFDPERSLTEQEREVYVEAYTGVEALEGGFAWFKGLPTTVEENLLFARTPLMMPVLGMGGEASFAALMQAALAPVVADTAQLTIIAVPQAGHWLVEEQTELVEARLLEFFNQND